MLWWCRKWEPWQGLAHTKFRRWRIFHSGTNCSFHTSSEILKWKHDSVWISVDKCCSLWHLMKCFSLGKWYVSLQYSSPELHLQSRRASSAALGLCEGISPHRCVCWGKPRRGSRSSPSPGWERERERTQRSTSPKHTLRIKGHLRNLLLSALHPFFFFFLIWVHTDQQSKMVSDLMN